MEGLIVKEDIFKVELIRSFKSDRWVYYPAKTSIVKIFGFTLFKNQRDEFFHDHYSNVNFDRNEFEERFGDHYIINNNEVMVKPELRFYLKSKGDDPVRVMYDNDGLAMTALDKIIDDFKQDQIFVF